MNPDKLKKQSIKVIISEAIMVVAVAITVIVLALLVSGYWLNSDFKVERNGMLQISSVPTGANVEIDDHASSWLERTNSSKILSSGEHTVTLTKDGYDSWSKTISITEGLLYRLHYPRLFRNNRTASSVLSTTNYTQATVSSDHNSLLLTNDTTKWAFINLDSNKIAPREIDISKLFSGVSLAEGAEVGLFTGEILSFDWDYDSEHILIQSKNGDEIEWVLLDINHVDRSFNLNREFGTSFSDIVILDNNSNNLLVTRNNNLHRINVPSRQISGILVNDVISYDHFGNEVVFSARHSGDQLSESPADYYIGFFKTGDDEITEMEDLDAPAQVVISKFYDSKYITVVTNQSITVHQKDDYSTDIASYEISFVPDLVEVGHDGEYIILTHGTQIATLDFEASLVREWSIESDYYGWLDNDMLYAVSDGNLIVYDYDGLNRRIIADNVSSHFPASITSDKWLYYFSDDNLVRESLE